MFVGGSVISFEFPTRQDLDQVLQVHLLLAASLLMAHCPKLSSWLLTFLVCGKNHEFIRNLSLVSSHISV